MFRISKAARFYQILRDYLHREGVELQILDTFEKNPKTGRAELANSLSDLLQNDSHRVIQLAQEVGKLDPQFATFVLGGEVEQILNIAYLGVLQIRLYIFRDVRQVLVFLAVILAVAAVLGLAAWMGSQPPRKTQDFYIAVAEFVHSGDSPEVARMAVERLHSLLDGEYLLVSYEKVQVEHSRMGLVRSDTEARELAERTGADVVIYGSVLTSGGEALITPKFYVADSFRADLSDLAGQHWMGAQIRFKAEELLETSSPAQAELRHRSLILIEFTKALVYRGANQLPLALQAIHRAIEESELYGDFKGKETLFLFAAEISRLEGDMTGSQAFIDQALQHNPNYGRAFILLGNLAYNQDNLEAARQYYIQAASLEDQPFGAHLQEKANLGLANTCALMYRATAESQGTEAPGAADFARCALDGYMAVIRSFDNQARPDYVLRELASQAYYESGQVYRLLEPCPTAWKAFEKARELSGDPDLRQRAQNRRDETRLKCGS